MSVKTVTAKEVQELRQRTGAGMMDCKAALVETGGDMNSAVEYLRKKGIAKAEKRAGRTASQGRLACLVAADRQTGILLELNSETDFVARNEEFGALTQSLAEQLLGDAGFDGVVTDSAEGAFLTQRYHRDRTKTVDDVVKEAAGRTGENIVLRRYARFRTDGTLGSYLHHNGVVAVLVDVDGPRGTAATELANELAIHIAGAPVPPHAVRRDEIPSDIVDRERRIFEEKTRAEGKPEAIIGKIVDGQIRKFFADVTLLEQPWVRDDSKTIQQLIDERGKAAGATFSVRRFVRFRMGEE